MQWHLVGATPSQIYIYIGTNVKSIGGDAFQNCPIETATIPDVNPKVWTKLNIKLLVNEFCIVQGSFLLV